MRLYNLIYSSFSKVISWIKFVFQEHTFNSEYIMLLEIGAFIGYILIIIFLFMIQYKSLQRSSKTNKHPIQFLMALDIIVTCVALSLAILPLNLGVFMLSFILYILFFIFVEKSKEYYSDDTKVKHLHSN
jgi:phosphatidylglycerophosphate synthase